MSHPTRRSLWPLGLALAAGLTGSPAAAQAPIVDFTYSVWHPWGRYGQGAVVLNHAQLVYAGYRETSPGQADLWYSHALAGGIGDNYLQPGELDVIRGGTDSAEFNLVRPPGTFPPPFHLLALATLPSGELVIGSRYRAPWETLSFSLLFPGVDYGALVQQVRSDDLQGGPVQSLLEFVIRQGSTLTLPAPLPEIDFEAPGAMYVGSLWGFDASGNPVALGRTFQRPDGSAWEAEAVWNVSGRIYAMPEATTGWAVPLVVMLGIGGLLGSRRGSPAVSRAGPPVEKAGRDTPDETPRNSGPTARAGTWEDLVPARRRGGKPTADRGFPEAAPSLIPIDRDRSLV